MNHSDVFGWVLLIDRLRVVFVNGSISNGLVCVSLRSPIISNGSRADCLSKRTDFQNQLTHSSKHLNSISWETPSDFDARYLRKKTTTTTKMFISKIMFTFKIINSNHTESQLSNGKRIDRL